MSARDRSAGSASPPVPPAAAERYDWTFFRRAARPHARRLILAQLCALAATAVTVPLPLLFPALVDEVLLGNPGPALATIHRWVPAGWQNGLGYVAVILAVTLLGRGLGLLLGVVQEREFTLVAKDLTFRVRLALLGHLGEVSLAEYETLGSGAVASRLVSDVNTVDSFLGSTLSRLVVSVLTVVGVAAILLWMHWQLALLIIGLNPLVIYLSSRLGRRVKQLKRDENQAVEGFQDALTETLDAMHELRAASRGHHYLAQLTERARAVRDRSASFGWKSDAANRFSFLVFRSGFDVLRAVAMLMVLFSGLTIGQMFAVYAYLWYLMGPVQELLRMHYSFYAADGALERINALLALRREPSYPALENPFAGRRSLAVAADDLHFAYGDGPAVLAGVQLEIEAGQRVALVGASGGGKSTFVQALLGLYPPHRGELRFGGVPVARIGWERVRENVATVLQHPALFNDTVRANLTLGRDRDDAQLWQALEVAQLRDDVERLELGLDTPVGRRGTRFSGGQRQRLAIARMILAEPKIVILDEATSALDLDTESRLYAALEKFLAGRTTLIIAHRLSALRLADRIYVFECGRVLEHGSHHELMAREGLYARIYSQVSPAPRLAVTVPGDPLDPGG